MLNRQTNIIKKRYDRISSVFDVMDQMIKPSWREELLKGLKGNILEVGVGTGSNLLFYPADVHVTGIDFSPKMLAKAYDKVGKSKAKIKLIEMDAQQMEFPDNTFDAVVSTCVFCSVPDPIGANVNRKTMENIENAGLKILNEEYLMTSVMRKLTISPNKSL